MTREEPGASTLQETKEVDVKKQELSEKDLGKISGGARGASVDGSGTVHVGKHHRIGHFTRKPRDGGVIILVPKEPDLTVKNLGQIKLR